MREWELKLGTFEKSLFDIISRINAKLLVDCQNIPKSNLIHFFNLEFKENAFKDIIEQDILKLGTGKDSLYDPDMLKILFFLLTKSNVSVNNNHQNQDKAKFLYSVLKDDTEELDSAIDRENPVFVKFIQTCVTMATVTLVDAYYAEIKTGNRENELYKLRNTQSALVIGLIDEIFAKVPKGDAMSFVALNKVFDSDPWCLTSGYIREVGLNLMKKTPKVPEKDGEKVEEKK